MQQKLQVLHKTFFTGKIPRKTETYESAKCVPCNTRKCTHNGFVSDLLKWALKCRFYATDPGIYLPRKIKVEPDLSLLRDKFSVRYGC